MKHTQLFLHIALMLLVGYTGCARQYDDPQDYDFNIKHEGDAMDVQVTGYRGTNKVIRIPPQFEDYDITEITYEAFAGKGLTGVVIPDSVYHIERRAFADNMLTKIIIPADVSRIGEEAFAGNRLTGIIIPDVVAVYSGAFKGNAITRITVGANVYISNADDEYEEEPAFEFDFAGFYETNKRRAGTYIYRDGRWSMHYDIVENGFAAIKIDKGKSAKIIDYFGTNTELSIPARLGKVPVTEIEDWAFFEKGLTGVVIPQSVTVIGENSFAKNKLTGIVIPGSIKGIADEAFADNDIVSVSIGEGVISIGWKAFTGNRIVSIVIPSTVTAIAGEAFEGNMLTSITIPESVTWIGYKAFFGNQLTEVTIPGSVTTIGGKSFADNQITGVIFHEGVTSISTEAFANNKITAVIIPNSVIRIGEEAFDDMVVLEYIYDDWNDFAIEIYEQSEVVITGYNGSKSNVKIPPYINHMPVIGIGADAFMRKKLYSVLIPDTIIHIGDRAFFYNELTEVTIPGNVSHIWAGAFHRNYIREITIPHSVAVIEDWAFTSNRFEKITIGAQVTVKKNAFSDGFSDFYNRNNRRAGTYQLNNKKWQYTGTAESNALAVEASKKRVTAAKSGPWNNIEKPRHPMDRYDETIIFANEAIWRNPEDSSLWSRRGYSRERGGDWDGAIEDFTEAIRLNPRIMMYWFHRGYVYSVMNEDDKAIADYTEVIRLNPDFEAAYINRAVAYDRKGDKEKALADIDRALAIDPENETAKKNRDVILNGPRLKLWFQ
jgi:predicted TPR repeat methyltransferase